MSLSMAQRSRPRGHGYWEWAVWIEGPVEDLESVRSVEYTLHPTFSPPVHTVTDRATHFRLSAAGWGEFLIHARVLHHDGRIESMRHWLEFADEAPTKGERSAGETALGRSSGPSRSVTGRQDRASPPREGPQALFLSSGLADFAVAARIRQVLEDRDLLDVSTSQDLQNSAMDEPFEELIQAEIGRVGGAVFVISEQESPWLQYEIQAVQQRGLPTAIVNLGRPRALPIESGGPNLVVQADESSAAEQIADQIAAWAEGLEGANPIQLGDWETG